MRFPRFVSTGVSGVVTLGTDGDDGCKLVALMMAERVSADSDGVGEAIATVA